MDAVGDEVKGRSALHLNWSTSVVREHENGDVIGRGLAPPSLPSVIRPGAARRRKHVAAHDPGAEVLEAARGEVVVDALPADLLIDQRSREVAGHFLERLGAE